MRYKSRIQVYKIPLNIQSTGILLLHIQGFKYLQFPWTPTRGTC